MNRNLVGIWIAIILANPDGIFGQNNQPKYFFGIGINNFGLRFSHNDVYGTEAVLNPAVSHTVISGAGNANRQGIVQQLTEFNKRVPAQALFVFCYSGHCVLDKNGNAYLVPELTAGKLQVENLVPLNLISELIAQNRAKQKIVFLDCCHSGTVKGIEVLARKQKALPAGVQQFRATIGQIDDCIMIASCDNNEVSVEDSENSVSLFTKHLCNALAGWADIQGNNDGVVDSLEVFQYVLHKVNKEAKTKFKRSQNPKLITKSKKVPIFELVPRGQIRLDLTKAQIDRFIVDKQNKQLFFSSQKKATANASFPLSSTFTTGVMEFKFDFVQGENVSITLGQVHVEVLGVSGGMRLVVDANGIKQRTEYFKLKQRKANVTFQVKFGHDTVIASATNVGSTDPIRMRPIGFDSVQMSVNIFAPRRNVDFRLREISVTSLK